MRRGVVAGRHGADEARRDVDGSERKRGTDGPLNVAVDLNKCQGYAQCCYAAPAHFAIEGHEALFYEPAPPAADRADIERARIACPVQAIRVEDVSGNPV